MASRVSDEEHWSTITMRDAIISSETTSRAMEQALVSLSDRVSKEVEMEGDFQEDSQVFEYEEESLDLARFELSLPRFLNSEIQIGKRAAFGNFADIYLVSSWKKPASPKLCTPEQKEAADAIKKEYEPDQVVVKVLRSTLLLTPTMYATGAADILTEGTILASLDHPFIVKLRGRSMLSVDGFGTGKRDSFFLVMERIQCNLLDQLTEWQQRSSQNRIVRNGIQGRRLNKAAILRERIQVLEQLADAMTYLHSHFIIHRDLKLANVGIDFDGNVKLIDFGLTKLLPPHHRDKATFRMTPRTGSIRYMAPEVARGDRYNLKADVYSFAIVAFEVMNLGKSWQGMQPEDIQERVVIKKQRPSVSVFWPVAIRDLLKSTWSDVPAGRLSMVHVRSILSKLSHQLQNQADDHSLESDTTAPGTTEHSP